MDLWVYQEIIWETQVQAIVEIGVMHGGTSMWLSDMLRSDVGDAGSVISIDLNAPGIELPSNVTFVEGDSLDPDVTHMVREACAGRRTMVIADGEQSAEHVLGELRTYGSLVSPGCYFIAEDTSST
jgi:cephalosporin hydroxylase